MKSSNRQSISYVSPVPRRGGTKQGAEAGSWVEASIWTERMLAALGNGVNRSEIYRFLKVPVELTDRGGKTITIGREQLTYDTDKSAGTVFVAPLNFLESEGYVRLGAKKNGTNIYALESTDGGVSVFQDGIFVTQDTSLLPEGARQFVVTRINLMGQDKSFPVFAQYVGIFSTYYAESCISSPKDAKDVLSTKTHGKGLTGMIEAIRKKISQEEFDYQTLLDCLKDYARPRDKISDLLKKRVIIRIKKGLYIFGDEYRRRPYSREILANLIYGPSYISLDYALQHYGLIPERVEALTSVTTGRSHRFSTPVGLFTYRMIPLEVFRFGMDRIEIDNGRAFLMATPEKALADKLHDGRGVKIQTQKALSSYLEENLRIDPAALRDLKPAVLDAIAGRYRCRKVTLLNDLLRRIHHQTAGGNVHA